MQKLRAWQFCGLFWCLPLFAYDVELCQRFVLRSNLKVSFTADEKTLICGNKNVEAWDNVTDNQALYHLKVFLQDRGYFNPKPTRREKNKILVDAGKPSYVSGWTLVGTPPNVHPERLRHIQGELLTPKLLDSIKARLEGQLQAAGYACPKVEPTADPDTGEVHVKITSGLQQTIKLVKPELVPGLNVGVLERYHAFLLGDIYNRDFLTVTENRILADHLLQNTHFLARCEPDGVALEEKNIAGDPRLLSFGFGVNTERWLTGRASWQHLRMGETGSQYDISATGSFTDQQLTSSAKWYFLPNPSRFYLHPILSFEHQNVDLFEDMIGTLQLTPGTTWEGTDVGLTLFLGPTLNFIHTVRGAGPTDSKFLSLTAEAKLESHYHEFYQASPRTGFALDLTGQAAQNNVLSDVTAQMVRLGFESLWNLGESDPPWFIIGIRGAVATTFTTENPDSSLVLPVSFRQFLGGSTDLRGFNRPELPDVNGGLTVAWTSFEMRWPDVLPWNLRPLAFIDSGFFGKRKLELDNPLFWSPGGGLRWESPLGILRTTLSHGFVSNSPDDPRAHWKFYFSYGEEF